MRYRPFGRTGWLVSEVGYGMWGLAGWTGSDDEQTRHSLQLAVEEGCTFFDTAWAYGEGRSERMLGELVRDNPDRRLYTATKVPPRNRRWPTRRGDLLDEVFPADYIREYAHRSLENLGLDSVDLLQFHVWEDAWAEAESWQTAVTELKDEGLIGAVGISINRWEPWNAIRTLQTGFVDAVQVIYNIFDQAPEDELFPYCQARNIAVIARVPLDEGALTGTLTHESRWPEGDWRNLYFNPERLGATIARVARLMPLVPDGMDLPELALRFILEHSAVSTTIPGMRTQEHVGRNLAASDGVRLPPRLSDALKAHRWDRPEDRTP
jgi:aryl-alcohol dehydrogenase-like predicted oxidoreductase